MQTYLMTDGWLFKIGKSTDPIKRLNSLRTANPRIELVCFGEGISESELHNIFKEKRIKREWFNLSEKDIRHAKSLIKNNLLSIKEISSLKAKGERNKSYSKYVINFGKYKGRTITTMKSEAERNYIEWYIADVFNKKKSKERTLRDKSFAWWYFQIK